MGEQAALDLVHQVDAPAGSILIAHVPRSVDPLSVCQLGEIAERTGLPVFVLHGCTLETVTAEQMAAAGWVRSVDVERARRQVQFLEALADGGELRVNGIPWREAFETPNTIVADPLPPAGTVAS